jgi:hypothetical protein
MLYQCGLATQAHPLFFTVIVILIIDADYVWHFIPRQNPPFTPEIVDCIIDQLRGDDTTLKQCSLVSWSFHPPSRRNLFFLINLDTFGKVDQLHHLLSALPKTGRDIRQLAVTMHVAHEWFMSNTILADIIGMLPGLNMFLWGTWTCPLWHELSSQLRTVLVTLFRSSSLTTVAIRTLNDFPLSVFHTVPAIKRLKLSFMRLQPSDRQLVMLPRLEMLIIQSQYGERAEVKLIVPNLRQLSFTDNNEQSAALAQQAIDTAAGTLERIRWEYNLNRGTWTSRFKFPPH